MEDAKIINSSVFNFGLIGIGTTIVGSLVGLLLLNYSLGLRIQDERAKQDELRTQLADQQNTIYDLRRALDRTEGRLGVYEDFLIGTQVHALKRMVRDFLRSNKVKSTEVTLLEFEQWANQKVSYPVGIGG